MGEWRYSCTLSEHWHWMEVSCQLYTPVALTLEKSPQYQFDRRLSAHHSQSGCSGKEKISVPAEN